MSDCPNVHVVHFIEGGWRWGGFLSSLCSPSFSFPSALRSSSHKLDVLLVDALIHREATELTAAGDDVARVELGSHVCGAHVGSVRIRLKLFLMMGWSTCHNTDKASYFLTAMSITHNTPTEWVQRKLVTHNFVTIHFQKCRSREYRVEKNGPRARASLRLPGTGERERRGNTEPFEGLFSRPDILNWREGKAGTDCNARFQLRRQLQPIKES